MLRLLFLAATAFATTAEPAQRHPHFEKKIEAKLPRAGGESVTVSVTHLTATCDRKGFDAMQAGGTWHLANTHLELTGPVEIGGVAVPAGKYRVVARKKDERFWELVLDEPGRFRAQLGAQAKPLKTAFRNDAPRREHLHLDIDPSGDKEHTVVDLVVNFDTCEARARIVVPKA